MSKGDLSMGRHDRLFTLAATCAAACLVATAGCQSAREMSGPAPRPALVSDTPVKPGSGSTRGDTRGRVVDAQDQSEDTRAIREINDRVAADDRVQSVMIALSDGLTLARRLG